MAATPSPQESALASLSPREQDVLHGIARGASNKEIARDYGIVETTVKIHVQHILRKLGVSSGCTRLSWRPSMDCCDQGVAAVTSPWNGNPGIGCRRRVLAAGDVAPGTGDTTRSASVTLSSNDR